MTPVASPAKKRDSYPAESDRTGNSAVAQLSGAEFWLIALSLSSIIGLTHLFTSTSFLTVALLGSLASHLLALVTRRMGLPIGKTIFVSVIGLVVQVSWLALPGTTWLGLPTLATLRQALDQLSKAWDTFQLVVAPAPIQTGFVVAIVITAWLIAFVSDVAAFRAMAPVEAAAPASALFAFGAVLGQSRQVGVHRLTTTVFLVCLGGYWLMEQLGGKNARLSSEATRSRLVVGATLGAMTIFIAVAFGPTFPGMSADALIPWREDAKSETNSRVTVSPLIDIRSRIVNQSEVEAFEVQSEARSYWRLTSLERFDGQIWSSEGRYSEASGQLPVAMPPTAPASSQTVFQRFTIKELSSIWLPAAFQPTSVKGSSVRWEAASASLITDKATAHGQTYEVTSTLTSHQPSDLRTAAPPTPSTIKTTYLKLPSNFSPRLAAEARRVVSQAPTAYDKARQLQDYFRTGFTYDLNVAAGHTENLMERFVFETKRGYCEQFAGSFAAMARSVGLPARVAVGFTPGEETAPGHFVVRGANGHAWPEVYLAGYGWVAFEPTPGRGIPNAEAYTGAEDPKQEAPPATLPSTAAPNTTPTPTAPPPPIGTPVEQDPPSSETGPNLLIRTLIAIVLLGFAIGAWIGAVTLMHRHRDRRRRALAVDPDDVILVSWTEADEALSLIGAERRLSETPLEHANRVTGTTTLDQDLIRLAQLATVAAFGSASDHEELRSSANWALATSLKLRSEIISKLSRSNQIKRRIDPRRPTSRSEESYSSRLKRS